MIVRVCRKMFLNTLGLKEWTVLNWVKERSENDSLPLKENKKAMLDERRRNDVKDFFNALPKIESHYCRADTTRIYLEPVWESKQHLHREYTKFCEERKTKAVKIKAFGDVMEEMKLSMFQPRKDRCDIHAWVMKIKTLILQRRFIWLINRRKMKPEMQ